MTDEDIKRIVICREAIDKHRAFNRARVEALAISTSVADAKSIIEAKIGTTTIAVDASVKPTQEIKAILEEERTKSTLEMNQIIKEQGFVNEQGEGSASIFRDWYNKVILELFIECHPIIGNCDWCGEKELNAQPCLRSFPKDACVFGDNETYSKNRNEYTEGLRLIRTNNIENIDGFVVAKTHCPEGHGYHADTKNFKPAPNGIDFGWKV